MSSVILARGGSVATTGAGLILLDAFTFESRRNARRNRGRRIERAALPALVGWHAGPAVRACHRRERAGASGRMTHATT